MYELRYIERYTVYRHFRQHLTVSLRHHGFLVYNTQVISLTLKITKTLVDVYPDWEWKKHAGQKMINKVARTFQVDRRVHCMSNCTVSPICDSYNYRPSDKTCQLNTHDTQHTLDSCVHARSGLVLLTRHASSTHTTLNTF